MNIGTARDDHEASQLANHLVSLAMGRGESSISKLVARRGEASQ
jgi:hypothetical protein